MDRRVHGIGTDGALEQLVYAGGRGNPGVRAAAAAAMGFGGCVVGEGGLLVHPVDRRHALDAVRVHASSGEEFVARTPTPPPPPPPPLSALRSSASNRVGNRTNGTPLEGISTKEDQIR